LRDDDTVYKALQPSFDFTLSNGDLCFIAEILIWPGDVGPQQVEIFVSNSNDKWTFVKEFTCARDGITKLTVPGEYIARYLRLRCINNTRGGNIISTRYIVVRGVVTNGNGQGTSLVLQ